MDLSDVEVRVLGSLIEKQLTTPQQYPLTLNALTLACNQTTARDPVTSYDTTEVERAATSLKQAGFARFVHPSHGRSALRYQQLLDEVLELSTEELAVVAVLALRGPQTPGELRQRAERMAGFSSVSQVEAVLSALAGRAQPLVAGLGRRPGQKEERYGHLLGGLAPVAAEPAAAAAQAEEEVEVVRVARETGVTGVPGVPGVSGVTGYGGPGSRPGSGPGPGPGPGPGLALLADRPGGGGSTAELRAEVAELRAEVAELRAEVTDLRAEVTELRDALRELRDDLGA